MCFMGRDVADILAVLLRFGLGKSNGVVCEFEILAPLILPDLEAGNFELILVAAFIALLARRWQWIEFRG